MSLAFKLASDLDTRLSVGESEWVSQPSTGGIACAGRCSLSPSLSAGKGRGEGRGTVTSLELRPYSYAALSIA